MKQHKKLLMDLVFAAVILAAAAVLLLVRKANQTGAPLCAELIYGDSMKILADVCYDLVTIPGLMDEIKADYNAQKEKMKQEA